MTANPTPYTFTVDGALGDHWSSWLGHLTLTRHEDGSTTLAGPIADQAQLHGVLDRLRDLGVTLLAVRADPAPAQPDGGAPTPSLARPIRTSRLLLRAGRPEDAEATFAYRRLDSVARWLTSQPSDLEEYRATFVSPDRLASTVVVELDGEVIGDLMLRVEDAWSQTEVADAARRTQAELGWALSPDHTGHGYATEAVEALLRHCFAGLGLRRVTASAFADNHASRRLMERVGMRLEAHTVRESLHRSGQWLDGVAYAVLTDEWNTLGDPS